MYVHVSQSLGHPTEDRDVVYDIRLLDFLTCHKIFPALSLNLFLKYSSTWSLLNLCTSVTQSTLSAGVLLDAAGWEVIQIRTKFPLMRFASRTLTNVSFLTPVQSIHSLKLRSSPLSSRPPRTTRIRYLSQIFLIPS